MIQEQHIPPQPLERYAPFVDAERLEQAREASRAVAALLRGRAIWNINSTGAGGGVAELLHGLLGYVRGTGIDARWSVISGPPEFFALTRSLHDALHGVGPFEVTPQGRQLYEAVLAQNAVELDTVIEPGDVVILHDPQTAGLAPHLLRWGARVIWRCHVGHDRFEASIQRGWDFLAPYLADVPVVVFTRPSYVPPVFAARRVQIIPPSIDPTSPKNQELPQACIRGILVHVGVLQVSGEEPNRCFVREDGTPGRVDRYVDVVRLGGAIPLSAPMVLQVSRWDHLKDPIGVMHGFVRCLDNAKVGDAQLVLAGPNVHGVADDPAAAESYSQALDAWRALPHPLRHHVHLVTLPMADVDENAAIVNALQRHATIVVQKSLHEGFGLTVAEAMWKGKPVIAGAVGGIRDQIEDGVDGLLVPDPADLGAFAEALARLLSDPPFARQLGERARAKVRERYLGLESLISYAALVASVIEGSHAA